MSSRIRPKAWLSHHRPGTGSFKYHFNVHVQDVVLREGMEVPEGVRRLHHTPFHVGTVAASAGPMASVSLDPPCSHGSCADPATPCAAGQVSARVEAGRQGGVVTRAREGRAHGVRREPLARVHHVPRPGPRLLRREGGLLRPAHDGASRRQLDAAAGARDARPLQVRGHRGDLRGAQARAVARWRLPLVTRWHRQGSQPAC